MNNSSSFTSNSVMQPAVLPSISCSVSSVIHQIGSSLPCTSNDPESDGQANSSQEPDLDADFYECSFCYEPLCKDGKEWIECDCGHWVHEQCLEDIIIHEGEEQFCPSCITHFLYHSLFFVFS